MSNHTPGPWDFNSFALREEIRAENNPLIATVCSVHCDSPEQMRANARLIAAAPELLEALEQMVGLFEPGRVYDFKEVSALTYEALSIAISAIAKATGVLAKDDSKGE